MGRCRAQCAARLRQNIALPHRLEGAGAYRPRNSVQGNATELAWDIQRGHRLLVEPLTVTNIQGGVTAFLIRSIRRTSAIRPMSRRDS